MLQCAEWICGETALWLKAQSRYQQAVDLLLEVSRKGMAL
jgi:hypothetical protein